MSATKHRSECARVFKNYDPACPRCAELASGSAPRGGGWNRTRRRDEQARARSAAIRAHDCSRSGCGPVCTRFDW